jgi:hypothetical protein
VRPTCSARRHRRIDAADQAVAGGPAVFLAVLGLLLLALWTAFRMQWRPSQPFELARRRALGQILSASLRMYRHNPLMYLTIGALFLPASIVIALLQHLLFALTQLDVLSQVAGPTNAVVAGSALAIGLVFGSPLTWCRRWSRSRSPMPRMPPNCFRVTPTLSSGPDPFADGGAGGDVRRLSAPADGRGDADRNLAAVRWSLFAQCIVLEDLAWRAGLARSHALVRGHWWRVAAVTLAVVGFAMLSVRSRASCCCWTRRSASPPSISYPVSCIRSRFRWSDRHHLSTTTCGARTGRGGARCAAVRGCRDGWRFGSVAVLISVPVPLWVEWSGRMRPIYRTRSVLSWFF